MLTGHFTSERVENYFDLRSMSDMGMFQQLAVGTADDNRVPPAALRNGPTRATSCSTVFALYSADAPSGSSHSEKSSSSLGNEA